MPPEVLAHRIELLINSANDLLSDAVIRTQGRVYIGIQALLKDLELDTDGYIKQNSANRAIIREAGNVFNKSILDSGYYDSVGHYLSNIDDVSTLNEAYFTALSQQFKPNKLFIQDFQKQTVSNVETLLTDGLQIQVREPLLDILNQNINTGGSFEGMLKQVQGYIKGTENLDGRLLSYSKQITRDALFNYARSYQQSVVSDLGLEYYQYVGGVMDSSRPFCVERHEGFFHQKEVEQWAALEWQGKARGTTESSIFIFAGGYNCGHQILAVSDFIVPKEVIERNNKSLSA